MVSVINGVVAGVFIGVLVEATLGATVGVAVALGGVAFTLSVLVMKRQHSKAWMTAEQRLAVRFPEEQ
jgi:hypothetical protein